MTTPSRIRSSLALLLLAGSSLIGCGSETPPTAAPTPAPAPGAGAGPPSGAAADAAAAKSAKK